MKKNIHPEFYISKFTDISTGKVFNIGSTVEEINVEVSSASHPFYTGEARIIDIENRVDKFKKKAQKGSELKTLVLKKKEKQVNRKKSKVSQVKSSKMLTLRDMLKNKI
ncbi:50S ribosomal protein L31 [Candidatus Dojkabacteria bacterium]|nr:50S ribosomal protein L31 [Candidatus Dojkabacteria bacterium]